MNEEENKAIEFIKEYEEWAEYYNPGGIYIKIPLSNDKKNSIKTLLNLIEKQQKEIEMYKYTGKKVKNKNSGKYGIILRVFENGNVQVLENINPVVINTHDNFNTLEMEEE